MTASKRKKALRKLEDSFNDEETQPAHYELMKRLRRKNIDICGYLRHGEYHPSEQLFTGSCALRDFEKCDYPCHLPTLAHGKYIDFECPTYRHFMKEREKIIKQRGY